MSARRRIIAVAALVVAVVAALVWLLAFRGEGDGVTAAGTVEATEADLGFNAAGRIASIAVREGESVAAAQELARLEADELEARVEAARAQAAAAGAQLAELERGARPEERAQARSAVRAAEQRVQDARRDLERARRLFEGGAISREVLDKAETSYELAQEALEQAQEQARVVERGPRPERIAAARAQVEQAEAALRQAQALLANALIRAPFAGVVTIRHREPGETVAPGAPVLTLMNPADRWVRIYVPEDRIGRVSLGQPAHVWSDSYPDRRHDARVTFIAPEAEFTPRNVQTPEERVKLVYAVKVEILGDPDFELKPGVPADVRLLEPDEDA